MNLPQGLLCRWTALWLQEMLFFLGGGGGGGKLGGKKIRSDPPIENIMSGQTPDRTKHSGVDVYVQEMV